MHIHIVICCFCRFLVTSSNWYITHAYTKLLLVAMIFLGCYMENIYMFYLYFQMIIHKLSVLKRHFLNNYTVKVFAHFKKYIQNTKLLKKITSFCIHYTQTEKFKHKNLWVLSLMHPLRNKNGRMESSCSDACVLFKEKEKQRGNTVSIELNWP